MPATVRSATPDFPESSVQSTDIPDMAMIAEQAMAKRALEIAASSGHNIVLHGPPGGGKSLLAKAMVGILPDLSEEEAFEVTKIWSIRGLLSGGSGVMRTRPFRSPHHSVSAIALMGGGTYPQPGEVALAHRGVLFLDEFAEFPRHVLEHLRQPLEDGRVHVSRASGSITFPARFTLVAAMNPCPCGYMGDPSHQCQCSPSSVFRYRERVSGLLLDRIDLHVHVPVLAAGTIPQDAQYGEPSADIRGRVQRACLRQSQRYGDAVKTNATLSLSELRTYCVLSPEGSSLVERAVTKLHLSARGIHRALRVARTIADLAGEERIGTPHLAEALQYRVPFTEL